MNRFRRLAVLPLFGLGLAAGCQARSRPAVAPSPEPAASPTTVAKAEPSPAAEPSKTVPSVEPPPQATAPKPVQTKPQADKWVIVREAFDDDRSTSCKTKWVRRNRFEVKTNNIRRLTVDMTKSPLGAPKRGPWIIIIDGQGVELTGFTPKPGYTGRKRDLVRSKNGGWTVDRRKLYRPGE